MSGPFDSTDLSAANGYCIGITGSQVAFFIKITPDASVLAYTTYLSGTSEQRAYAMVINAAGEVAIGGATGSTGFPTTAGAYASSYPVGTEAGFIARFNGTGDNLEPEKAVSQRSRSRSTFRTGGKRQGLSRMNIADVRRPRTTIQKTATGGI